MRIGECPSNMSKQLAFKQIFRQRRAIDGDKGKGSPPAEVMNRARKHFFAGPGLTRDQNGRGVARQNRDLLHRAQECRMISNEAGQPQIAREPFVSCSFVILLEGVSEQARDAMLQFIDANWRNDEIVDDRYGHVQKTSVGGKHRNHGLADRSSQDFPKNLFRQRTFIWGHRDENVEFVRAQLAKGRRPPGQPF